MKRILVLMLVICLLCGCTAKEEISQQPESMPQAQTNILTFQASREYVFESRFDTVTEVKLSDEGISVDGAGETDNVFTSHDIIYYEDKTAYDSGYPYGEGEVADRHSADEAKTHTVVNITAPGAYRVSGKLSAGQVRIDLGEGAYEDQDAIVELILSDADITCTVAPAILFTNVYECDGNWSIDTAKADVDTAAAGANLILEGTNTVSGSHVAKIFKDKEGKKKLWKQDGAIYSYMSMNVFGPGKLDLNADNEGLDTELHLTINGGEIAIRSDNDGINTNEDGVSVTTINGGNVHIMAGLGQEGDGIDSNGYLVINGGNVVSAANPIADAGLDSDLGSFVHGGNVIALGSAMDWAESDSKQVTMNMQFTSQQSADAALVVTQQDGTVIFAYDPSTDEVLAGNSRVYSGAVISCANFHVGDTYNVYVDGEVTGTDYSGIYDPTTVTDYTGGMQMAYTGTDLMGRPGGMGEMKPPEDMEEMKERLEGMEIPESFEDFMSGNEPEGEKKGFLPKGEGRLDKKEPVGELEPENMFQGMKENAPGQFPENFEPGNLPEGMGFPGGMPNTEAGEPSSEFYMQDKVNFFSGLMNV